MSAITAPLHGLRRRQVERRIARRVSERIEREGIVVHLSTEGPRVAVLGDSYSAGDELADRDARWVTHLAVRGYAVSVDGIGGTGYVAEGPCGDHAFGRRLQRLLVERPDVLVIQGGTNDHLDPLDDVRRAAEAVIARACAAVPRVVVVGPTNATPRSGLADVSAVLRRAAEAAGAEYVEAFGWDLDFLPDATHLTEAGHEDFAGRVEAQLL